MRIPLILAATGICAATFASPKQGKHGTYYLPAGLQAADRPPVLIMEKGLAARLSSFASKLQGLQKAIVIEIQLRGGRPGPARLQHRHIPPSQQEQQVSGGPPS